MLFTKRFSDLEVADFEELCAIQYPQSDQLEFKEYDPGKDAPDNWHHGADRISTYARDDVLAAFATAGAVAVVSEPAGAQAAMDGWDAVADTGYCVKRLR
jgi:hypothetical protein